MSEQCNCKKHEPMTSEEKQSAMMGLLTLLLIAGLIITSILLFFGGSVVFPNLFLAGLCIVFCYYAVKAHKAGKK